MMSSIIRPWVLSALVAAFLSECAVVVVVAHMEDYLIQQDTGTVSNLFELSSALDCSYQETTGGCVVATAKGAQQNVLDNNVAVNFRGGTHFDSVYVLAQATGFVPEMAYWIAAFSQSADFVQFKGLDSCGRDLPKSYWTPPMRGFMRTSSYTGGIVRHLGVPFGLVKPSDSYTGLEPDLENFEYEGTLSAFRKWARGETDVVCHGGFREPVNGNYFIGDTCLTLDSTLYREGAAISVYGPVVFNPNMTFGPQIIHYECPGNPHCFGTLNGELIVDDIVYATEFGSYLASRPEATLENGNPVPELIARMGVFLHMLADRASHKNCTDVDGTGVYRRSDGIFDTMLDTKRCNVILHALEHYWEQALNEPLPPQTYAALKLFYQELVSFRELVGDNHPEWFRPQDPDDFALLVGTPGNTSPLDEALTTADPEDRFHALLNVMDQFGYDRPPGFEPGSTETCPRPCLFVKLVGFNLPSPTVTRVSVSTASRLDVACIVALTGDQYERRYGVAAPQRRLRRRVSELAALEVDLGVHDNSFLMEGGGEQHEEDDSKDRDVLYISISPSCAFGDNLILQGLVNNLKSQTVRSLQTATPSFVNRC